VATGLGNRVAADVRGNAAPGRPDGFTSGSGGLWIVDPKGKPLGRIIAEEFPVNVASGGDDWKTQFFRHARHTLRSQAQNSRRTCTNSENLAGCWDFGDFGAWNAGVTGN
jgi:hypothetical protein